MNQNTKIPNRAMAILPLRGLNIFPGMLLSFDVERPISLAALNCAQNNDQEIFLVTQKDISNDMPQLSDLYEYGVVADEQRGLVRNVDHVFTEHLAAANFVGKMKLIFDKFNVILGCGHTLFLSFLSVVRVNDGRNKVFDRPAKLRMMNEKVYCRSLVFRYHRPLSLVKLYLQIAECACAGRSQRVTAVRP